MSFFGKAAIAVAVGCRSKCALVFLVFRHLGAHATVTQWLYTQDYANVLLLQAVFSV